MQALAQANLLLKTCKTLRMLISREQEAVIVHNDTDLLLELLDKHSDLTSQIESAIDEFREINISPETARVLQDCQSAIADINDALDETLKLLKTYQDDLRLKLTGMARNKNVASTYTNAVRGIYGVR